jgi:hypothetical protein
MTAEVAKCAIGVEYLSWVPGKRHFQCEKLSATMSTDDCATRWRGAQVLTSDARYSACNRCPVGSAHAGEANPLAVFASKADSELCKVVASPDEGNRCTRCGRSGFRLVGPARLCVSCWNRQREHSLGRNAKGKAPITFRHLAPRRIGIVVDGEPAYLLINDTQQNAEPLARAIRTRKAVVFHDEEPGIAAWNAERVRWEYRDRDDSARVMLESVVNGLLHYVSADAASLQPGDVLAVVRAPVTLMTAGEAAEWLAATAYVGDGQDVDGDWKPLDIVCDWCRVAQVQAKKSAGVIHCRCPACLQKS